MKIKPAKPQKDSQDEKLSVKKRRKWYYTFVISMAALVVFSTTYALILPAITMEKEDEQVYRVSDWSWEDSYGALTENEGEWYLSLPGADEDNPMTEESVRELLPGKVSATMSDGTTEELALEWIYLYCRKSTVVRGLIWCQLPCRRTMRCERTFCSCRLH